MLALYSTLIQSLLFNLFNFNFKLWSKNYVKFHFLALSFNKFLDFMFILWQKKFIFRSGFKIDG